MTNNEIMKLAQTVCHLRTNAKFLQVVLAPAWESVGEQGKQAAMALRTNAERDNQLADELLQLDPKIDGFVQLFNRGVQMMQLIKSEQERTAQLPKQPINLVKTVDVQIGNDGRCKCTDTTVCPAGKKDFDDRCTAVELSKVPGVNLEHDVTPYSDKPYLC